MEGKSNPYRFNLTFDPDDPLQKKAAEILNTFHRKRSFGRYISELMVIASQTQPSGMDWLKMQTAFIAGAEPANMLIAMDGPPTPTGHSAPVAHEADGKRDNPRQNNTQEPTYELEIGEPGTDDDMDYFLAEMGSFKLG